MIFDASERALPKDGLPLVYYEQGECFANGEGIDFMQFRLIYEGSLKSSGNSSRHVAEKHAIRTQFHGQISTLYDNHEVLKSIRYYKEHDQAKVDMLKRAGIATTEVGVSITETLARQFIRSNGFRFVPLVNKEYDLVCGLDVLFLRRENPGTLLMQGGDIDNRIKTLFDALRIPSDGSEIPKDSKPETGQDPFFCLLENDTLVTDLRITTDRLLRPLRGNESATDVVLVVHVNIKASKITGRNMSLLE